MSATVMFTIFIIVLYLIITISIGVKAAKSQKITSISDIFTASRSLGFVALAMAIFGSQITAFGILGIPGVAYNIGYSTMGYIGGLAFAPTIGFYIFGYRAWLLAHKNNYVTPVQFFYDRFNDNAPRFIIALAQITLMIPYILILGIGSGNILLTLTDGVIPYWLGSLIILMICTWTAYAGGMKGTAWTNIFQGALMFMAMFLLLLFVYRALGGGESITAQLPQSMISLGGEGVQNAGQWIPFSLLATGISNGVFGHILIRNMSAAHSKTIQMNVKAYPVLYGIFMFIAVALGVWGKVLIPGLKGAETENIIPMLAYQFAPYWMIGVLGAGILAAIMSSWDGMILTMSSIFSEDFYKPIFVKNKGIVNTNEQDKKISKIFIIIISIVIYILVLLRPASILKIATFSFAGMASITPAYFGCLYWKRATKWGVIVSTIVGVVFSALWALNILPTWTTFGMFYGAMAIILSIIALVVISYLTTPASQDTIKSFFSAFTDVYEDGDIEN